MAKLEGYTCDTCGKHGPASKWGAYPNGWYIVKFAFDAWNEYGFCSIKCFKTWAEVPDNPQESKGTLFRKLLKAIFA